MSRILIIVGLVASVAVHGWLLRRPRPAPPTSPATPTVVPVVETQLARRNEPTEVADRAAEDPVDEPVDEPVDNPADEPVPDIAPEPIPIEPPMPAPPMPEPIHNPTLERTPSPTVPERAMAETPPDEPPAPPLEQMAEPTAAGTNAAGDLAGTATGRHAPSLRVDWGTDAEAMSILELGGMQVVILDLTGSTPMITHEMVQDPETHATRWQRRTYQPPAGSMRYSNRLRIVDDVPAFRMIRAAARPGTSERLAVLVPVAIETMLESRQIAAAFDRGLMMQEITDFAGRFVIANGELLFEIVHVGEGR